MGARVKWSRARTLETLEVPGEAGGQNTPPSIVWMLQHFVICGCIVVTVRVGQSPDWHACSTESQSVDMTGHVVAFE